MNLETTNPSNPSESPMAEIAPVFDQVMHELDEVDRQAVLLRFFQGKDLAEVGEALDITSEAARKRISRALDKLRVLFQRRGINTSIGGLSLFLGAQSLAVAPPALLSTITTAALATASASPAVSLLTLITMTKIKTVALSSLLALGFFSTVLWDQNRIAELREQNKLLLEKNQALEQRLTPNAAPIAGSQATVEARAELLRLRDEVGRSRAAARSYSIEAKDPGLKDSLNRISAYVTKLKELLHDRSPQFIPEIRLLTDKDWIKVCSSLARLETEEDYRRAQKDIRSHAKSIFGGNTHTALLSYAKANGDALPERVSDLGSYFESPIDPSILERYKMLQHGKLKDAKDSPLLREIAPPVDEEFDTQFGLLRNGTHMGNVDLDESDLKFARDAFARANLVA